MISRSTFLHLRFLFSLFLLPVFLFAFYASNNHAWGEVMIIVAVWHLFAYPASNGYNSYFDKDEGSIALLKTPPKVNLQLYWVSLLFDAIALGLALTINWLFFLAVLVYGTLSKMYSHPAVRLKKYPWISFIIVAFFQGGFVCYFTILALNGFTSFVFNDEWILISMIASCIVGASYPLTQIYQHEEDGKRGDKTLSLLLGKRKSFVFSGILYSLSISMLLKLFSETERIDLFYLFLTFSSPVLIYFIYWAVKVWQDEKNASYQHCMRMNIISAFCLLIYFTLINFMK